MASLLEGAFARVDEAVEYFERFLLTAPAPAGRVCAVTVIKGRNLALGCYGLALDGLAQESGALLRPLLETIELLTYLRAAPGAVHKALYGKLPKAGKRAAEIGSPFQELRENLNVHASHLGFGADSMRHLLDIPAGRFRVVQPFNKAVLEQNMATLFVFTAILAREAALSFQWCGAGVVPASAESLVNKALLCMDSGEPMVKSILAKRCDLEGV
ncbi:MAG: hypothetical protein ACLQPN_03670 [Bryobacteraceae bacterium]